MASEKARKAAAARLRKLEGDAKKEERNKLRAQVAMGDRKTRKAAATKLSNMSKQWKD